MGNILNSNKSPLSKDVKINAAIKYPDVYHQFSYLPIDIIKCNTSILSIYKIPDLLCFDFKDYNMGGNYIDQFTENKNFSFHEFNISTNLSAGANLELDQIFPITLMIVSDTVKYDLNNYSVAFVIDSGAAIYQYFQNETIHYYFRLTLDQLHTDSSFIGVSDKIDYILSTKGNVFNQTQIPISTLAII